MTGSLETVEVDLDISGMTCAACATRIENRLNRLPGVAATVNLATEKARVRAVAGTTPAQLVAAVEAAGYRAALARAASAVSTSAETELRALQRRLVVSAVLAAPVTILSMAPVLQFPFWQWLVLVLALPVALWGAWPFHRAAFVNARHGVATMDTLISIGVLAATSWSLGALLIGDAGMIGMRMSVQLIGAPEGAHDELYLEVAALVTVFVLLGRVLERRARRQSGAALRSLLELGATKALVLREGVEVEVAAEVLVPGDRVVVRPGDTVPADGVVLEGASALDESMMTGESTPVEVAPGSRVIGASLNHGGALIVEVTRVGSDTELARLARLVEQAQTGKARVQRLADRVSAVFVPVVIVLAILAAAGWLLVGGDPDRALTAAITTLIVACPCALGLATPTALLVGTGRGAQLGIVIRGAEVLEDTRRVDTVVLDKTGTLTRGRMSLAEVRPVDGVEASALLDLAARAEHGSEHPIAHAIVAAGRVVERAPLDFRAHPGGGVEAVIDGRRVVIGRASWVAAVSEGSVPRELDGWIAEREEDGATVVVVASDGIVQGALSLADTLHEGSAATVARLRRLGLEPLLVTGDNAGAARAVAAAVGIDEVRAAVSPSGKLAVVRELQARGRVVAMVGDGVNDAAALAAADLGVALGTGTDVAIAASDLTIVRGDIRLVPDAILLARRTLATIRGNLFWAFAYNVAALPVAMVGLLNPVLAAAAMAFSSVFVVSNSLRLRAFTPRALAVPLGKEH